jgi:phosphotransferase system enzyme I (PtsI)
MAADINYVPVLLGLGLRRLSLALPRLPVVADLIRRLEIQGCCDLAAAMLASHGPEQAGMLLQQFHDSLPRRVARRSR